MKSSQMLYDYLSLRLSDSILGPPSAACQPWSVASESFLSVVTVNTQMIKETGTFVTQCMQRINDLVTS